MKKDKLCSKDKYGAGVLFIPAVIFIGIGIGFLIDNLVAGLFIGFGMGFALFAISEVMRERTVTVFIGLWENYAL